MRAAWIVVVMVSALTACGEVVGDEPEAVDVSISPSDPKTADDLVATASMQGANLRWSKNGVVRDDIAGAQVDNSLTAKGETWAVDVLSSKGLVIGHDEVVIGNTAPTVHDVEVQLSGTPNTPVPCVLVSQAIDVDGDVLTYSATWLRNGVAYASAMMTTFAGDTVPAADHAAGDQFDCTVVGSDGTEMVSASAGARVLVSNGTPPNGTLQMFTTPAVPSLRIEAAGARGSTQGAAMGNNNGATMIGTFAPAAGSVLTILVGQAPTGINLGGGGGTFVMAAGTTPMVIAGGGGSIVFASLPRAETVGRVETSGGTCGAVVRADNGQGGRINPGANSGGGGGLMTSGGGAAGGQSFVAGAAGGGVVAENQWGGYGGGGGRGGSYGQGGGGGYSGGSCGETFTAPSSGTWCGCGGGGSLNMGTNQVNTAGANEGDGYVKITW